MKPTPEELAWAKAKVDELISICTPPSYEDQQLIEFERALRAAFDQLEGKRKEPPPAPTPTT